MKRPFFRVHWLGIVQIFLIILLSVSCQNSNQTVPPNVTQSELAAPSISTVSAPDADSVMPPASTAIEPSPPVALELSRQARPLFFIVTSPTADTTTKSHANTLAEYLRKISGANFEITQDSMDAGIFVGTIVDFPESGFELNAQDQTRSNEYAIKSMENGLYVIGASPAAVLGAVNHVMQYIDSSQRPDPNKLLSKVSINIDHKVSR